MSRSYGAGFGMLCVAFVLLGDAATADDSTAAIERVSAFGALTAEAERNGELPVIVRLERPRGPGLRRQKGRQERFRKILREHKAAIALKQEAVTSALPGRIRRLHRFKYLPYLAMQADAETLEQLQAMPQVLGVYPDRAHPPSLDVSVPLIGATPTQAAGFDGGGQAIAILDTGVNLNHQFFTSVSVPAEACFSGTVVGGLSSIISFCDAGLSPCTRINDSKDIPYSQCGPGAGDPCTGDGLCWHGTHVAGIALGHGGGRYGTARGADLIPIQVFVKDSNFGLVAYDSDLIAALEHVLDLSDSIEIAAVNMSLGGDAFFSTTACDASSPFFKEAIDNLRAVGIATVIASGNGSTNDGISFPGCISSAISVGATDDSDTIAGFSNRSSALSLYAPGSSIYSSKLGSSSYGNASGTSMASPHVAGAMAILREKALMDLPVSFPNESCQESDLCIEDLVSVLSSSLRLTGKPIIDGSTGFEVPRIQVDSAVDMLADPPALEVILDAELVLSNENDIACNTSQLDVCVVNGTFDRLSSLAEYGCGGYAYEGCSALTDSYGGDALVGAAAGENAIRYRPGLTPDLYDVFVWWQAFPGLNTSAAEAVVKHTNGTREDLPLLDQTTGGGGWNHLGTFFLDDASYVELSDAGFPGMAADAIRFAPVGVIDPLMVATSTLPVAYVGYGYGHYLGALGGIPPYSWEILDGALPQGLTLDQSTGLISGTAQKAETASFTVQVVDDIGNVAERGLALTSTDDAPPPVTANINFQPANAAVPSGYEADTGEVFGDRGNGLSYGWNTDNTANARDRNSSASPDQRYDTLNHMRNGGESFSWELAVPNGSYEVRVVAGDPVHYTNNHPKVLVEGQVVVDQALSAATRWVEGTVIVTVSDGRLSLAPDVGYGAKLAFVEIVAAQGGNAPPTVSLTAPLDGTTFDAGDTIDVTANAADADGAVTMVEFFANGQKFGEDISEPYSLAWSDAPAGSYALTAVATDDLGASATSAPVTVSVVSGGGFSGAKINFHLAGAPVPSGYEADTGEAFGDRGDGLSYGWNKDNTANARDRNSSASPDQRYDTLNHMRNGGESFSWELAVPNGSYEVRVVAGDPVHYTNNHPKVLVEGQVVVDQALSAATRWVEGTVIVTVSDGRLSLAPDVGYGAKLAFVEIVAAQGGNAPPTVSLTAPLDGTTFDAGDTIDVTANAADADGAVTMVEFFANGQKFGEDISEPYSLAWSDAPAGSYALTAVATDDLGASATSAPVTVSVVSGGGFSGAKINFQLAGAPVPANYAADAGEAFGDRGDGLIYGWNKDNTANARDRNSSASPDQRYETLNHMHNGGESFIWELAVPNGSYEVRVVAGDPVYYTNNHPKVLVEGLVVVDQALSAATRWVEGTVIVTVSDGRLSLAPDVGYGAKLAFVEIVSGKAP